jgi:hypothetical protein
LIINLQIYLKMQQVQLVNLNLFNDITGAITGTTHAVTKIVVDVDPKAKGTTSKIDSGVTVAGGIANGIDSLFQPKLQQLDLFHDITGAISGVAKSTNNIVGDVGSKQT